VRACFDIVINKDIVEVSIINSKRVILNIKNIQDNPKLPLCPINCNIGLLHYCANQGLIGGNLSFQQMHILTAMHSFYS